MIPTLQIRGANTSRAERIAGVGIESYLVELRCLDDWNLSEAAFLGYELFPDEILSINYGMTQGNCSTYQRAI